MITAPRRRALGARSGAASRSRRVARRKRAPIAITARFSAKPGRPWPRATLFGARIGASSPRARLFGRKLTIHRQGRAFSGADALFPWSRRVLGRRRTFLREARPFLGEDRLPVAKQVASRARALVLAGGGAFRAETSRSLAGLRLFEGERRRRASGRRLRPSMGDPPRGRALARGARRKGTTDDARS